MADLERSLSKSDLLIARMGLRAVAPQLSEDSEGEALFQLSEADRRAPAVTVNPYIRSRAMAVFGQMQEVEGADKAKLDEVLRALKAAGAAKSLTGTPGLSIGVEEVTELAREEVQEIINFEAQMKDSGQDELHPLERAALNLEMINSWVDHTWLRSYIVRKPKAFVLHRSKANYVYNALVVTYLYDRLERIGRSEYRDTDFGIYSLILGTYGIAGGENGDPVQLDSLQTEWDHGKKWQTNVLASFDRENKARKILGQIK